MALRLLFLQTHYRQIMNFTWGSLSGANKAYSKLINLVCELKQKADGSEIKKYYGEEARNYRQKFIDAISDDLQTPKSGGRVVGSCQIKHFRRRKN